MVRPVRWRLVLALAALTVVVGCTKKGSEDKGGGSVTCTPSISVSLQTGAGSNNGLCTQLSTAFAVGNQVCACTSWACLANGDQIQFVWDGPAPNDHVDTFTRNDGQTSSYSLAYCHSLAGSGSWSIDVRRNGSAAATRSISVF